MHAEMFLNDNFDRFHPEGAKRSPARQCYADVAQILLE